MTTALIFLILSTLLAIFCLILAIRITREDKPKEDKELKGTLNRKLMYYE